MPILTVPWALLALLAVAAAAVWSLLRPRRARVDVGSLELWQRARRAAPAPARKGRRGASLAWWLLLAGAVLAVLAAAGPAWQAGPPGRRLAVGIVPAAEWGRPQAPRQMAAELLNRLNPADRVTLLLPPKVGGASEPLAPAEALRRVARLPLLPTPAAEIRMPAAAGAVQRTYWLYPRGAGWKGPEGPEQTHLPGPAAAPPATLKHLAAVAVGDGMELFASARLAPQQAPAGVRFGIRGFDPAGRKLFQQDVPATADGQMLADLPPADVVEVVVRPATASDPPGPGATGYLAARYRPAVGVALLGRPSPLLRRYVQADPLLRQVSIEQADLVLATAASPPADVAALVFLPPEPPPGWQQAPALGPVRLGPTAAAPDEPLLRGVSLRGSALREMRPWKPLPAADEPDASAVAAGRIEAGTWLVRSRSGDRPRRVYVAFAPDPAQTNFVARPAFPIFCAQAVRWLAEGLAPADANARRVRGGWGWLAPSAAAGLARRADGSAGPAQPSDGPLPWPGVYVDEPNQSLAVTLTGVAPGSRPAGAVGPAGVALPKGQRPAPPRPVGWLLALAAGACWLGGWLAAARRPRAALQ